MQFKYVLFKGQLSISFQLIVLYTLNVNSAMLKTYLSATEKKKMQNLCLQG